MEHPEKDNKGALGTSAHHPLLQYRSHRSRLPEGGITVTQVIMLAILFYLGLQGLKFVAPWYDNLRLAEAMQEALREASISTDAAVIGAVQDKAKQLKVPLDPRDIHLERSWHGSVRLWAAYEVTLTFPLGFSHTQRFRPEVRSMRE